MTMLLVMNLGSAPAWGVIEAGGGGGTSLLPLLGVG